jgi:hypothetical protein
MLSSHIWALHQEVNHEEMKRDEVWEMLAITEFIIL